MKTVKLFVEKFRNEHINYRNGFHRIAEPSYKELKTSEFIQKELKKFGIPYKIIGDTAVVAEIGSGSPVIGARFNMDGLEGCVERTAISIGPEYIGSANCMHACGHDVELAWAMAIAHYFSQHKPQGTVRLVFQPAEEGPGNDPKGRDGGKFLADLGAFDDLNALFSFHVDPDLQVGEICATEGLATVDAIDFEFHLSGISSHLSRPKEGINPIWYLSQIFDAVKKLRENAIDLASQFEWPYYLVLDISQVSAGLDIKNPLQAEINTLPNACIMRGSSRILGDSMRATIENGLKEIAKSADSSMKNMSPDASCKLSLNQVAVATLNDRQVVEMAEKAISSGGFKHINQVKYWKDAAGWTSQKAPVCHGYVGCGKVSGKLHTDTFYPGEEVLSIGAEIFIQSILNSLLKTNTVSIFD